MTTTSSPVIMALSNPPPNNSTTTPTSTMAAPSTYRRKPAQVQTSFLPPASSAAPTSAISASSVASSSQQASPIMSPQTGQLTTCNSSLQPSPEGPRGREMEHLPTAFELPESIVSRKTSQNAMSEAMGKSPGLIRRLSNRATQFAGRRRQSSTAARSRDHSTGPVIMRRRSDSNSTAPDAPRPSLYTDSDEDIEETDDAVASFGTDGSKDISNGSINGSVTPSTIAQSGTTGPVIPAMLLHGTTMTKVSRKKRKTLTFVLDSEAAKVSWDKNRPSKCFFIDDVKEVRTGADASNYRQEFGVPLEDEPRFFSILYTVPDKSGKGRTNSQKVMHLIAHDDQAFDYWTSTLDAVSKHRHEFMAALSSFNDKAVKTYWHREMSKQFGDKARTEEAEQIDFVGVERLCRSLHINVSNNYLRAKFAQADATGNGRLNLAEFQDFVKLMKKRQDVTKIYRDFASSAEKGLTQEEFFSFLKNIQGENVEKNVSHWEAVFAKMVRRSRSKEQALQDSNDGEAPRMSDSALTGYLTSTYNSPIYEIPADYQLDRPINEYFISSSHNTYLLGRQVAGDSSVEAYVSALSKGCRCVEVDCWNGSEGPVVMHGRTLTSQVSFADVMSTISKYAFVSSSFPLWISLEVHCNPVQQKMMAEIIIATCGDKLVTKPLEENATTLPTPMELLNRILIKVKAPHREREDAGIPESPISGRRRGNSFTYTRNLDSAPYSPGLVQQSAPMSPQQRPTRPRKAISKSQLRVSHGSDAPESLSSSTSDTDSLNEELKTLGDAPQRKKTSKIVPVLGDLGVYSAGLKFNGFDTAESKAYNHIFSFMESTFLRNSKDHDDRRALERHNMRYLMRVYPNGWRIASTNFDPLTYWRRGVQMVALNWQTYDLGMQMNDAMFASGTDKTGYVLKPAKLRGPVRVSDDPKASGLNGKVKKQRQQLNFNIDIVSAQQLMRPTTLPATRTVDPYVEVEVYHADDKSPGSKGVTGEGGTDASPRDGLSGLGAPHRRRTQIVQENGFNPVFNKKFNFTLTTSYPELVFVRFTVRTSPDGQQYSDRGLPLATYTTKLDSIKEGYRTLPLMNNNGDQFLFSTLFARIKMGDSKTEYVDGPSTSENVSVLKSIGRTIFSHREQLSPKSSMEKADYESVNRKTP